jgi:hypothetical protein
MATGSLLAPQAASAVDFTFSFAGVTGLIENLVEGQNTCNNAAPNSPACFVKVTNSSRSTGVGTYRWYEYASQWPDVGNFTVLRSGSSFFLVSADWRGKCDASLNCDTGTDSRTDDINLLFCDPVTRIQGCDDRAPGFLYTTGIQLFCITYPVCETDGIPIPVAPVVFAMVQPPTPSSSVPGPLPLFGAAAAFGYSRKLRNRIRKTSNSASTAFTL